MYVIARLLSLIFLKKMNLSIVSSCDNQNIEALKSGIMYLRKYLKFAMEHEKDIILSKVGVLHLCTKHM